MFRRARALALCCALTLTILFAALSVWLCVSDAALYERVTLSRAAYASVGMDAQAVRAFAQDTMAYLRGGSDFWQPDVPFRISESFRAHMASVRLMFSRAPLILSVPAALALLFLIPLLVIARAWRRARMPVCAPVVRCWFAGAALALLPFVLAAGWALADFSSFWLWLHQTFIPDGLFSAGEAVMALFPPALFADYVAPIALCFGVGLAATLAAGKLLFV